MNGKVKEVDFFLLVRCLYNKQNNTWLLGDIITFRFQLDITRMSAANERDIDNDNNTSIYLYFF